MAQLPQFSPVTSFLLILYKMAVETNKPNEILKKLKIKSTIEYGFIWHGLLALFV